MNSASSINHRPLDNGNVGIVVIGRNEGERLERCLRSLGDHVTNAVYVDSGSTDGSVAFARQSGAAVVELESDSPFTAAKARNAGLRRLLEVAPRTQFVQFIDGDCELAPQWLEQAQEVLADHDHVAVVCGRRREKFPQASRYNRLCEMEWNGPVGVVQSCGGDAMMRVTALAQVGGYRTSMIAGEEPELCIRLRSNHWGVIRIAAEMTLHDAAMFRFSQWWRRSVRAGHAFAETAWLHGAQSSRVMRRCVSILLWAAVVPLIALVLAWPTNGMSLVLAPMLYMLLAVRIFAAQRRRGRTAGDALLYATFVVLGKFAELQGGLRFLMNRLLRRRAPIIEYKTASWQPPAIVDTQ